jgi:ribosome-associated toxin RatA of RatAB toxin-antitoxin module
MSTTALARVVPGLLLCSFAQAICAGATNTYDSLRLSDANSAGLKRGEVIVVAEVDRDRTGGDVHAAIEIAASPEQIFRRLTDCAEAMKFVPHLEHCEVLESAPDGSWQIVEHRVDHGWFAPRARYIFRAEYESFRRIRFSNVSGDLRENRGTWEFLPSEDGNSTLVTYNAHIVPRNYVPRWLLRSALRSDLPALMKGLRSACESPDQAIHRG